MLHAALRREDQGGSAGKPIDCAILFVFRIGNNASVFDLSGYRLNAKMFFLLSSSALKCNAVFRIKFEATFL